MHKIIQGFHAPINALSYLTKNKLWYYAAIPIILSGAALVLFGFIAYFLYLHYFASLFDLDFSNLSLWLRAILFLVKWVIHIAIFIFLFAFMSRLFGIIASILIIPFLSPLVAKIFEIEGLPIFEAKTSQMIGQIFFAIVYSVKILAKQILLTLACLLTGPLQPVLMFLISNYYAGRSQFDYTFELAADLKNIDKLGKGYAMQSVGMGTFYNLAILVPIVGAILVPVLSVVGAALIVTADMKNQK